MSAIAKDASITLITAVPGSGKTLRVVWYIREALKANEQVFVCNLNGLSTTGDYAGWLPFEDPTKWEQLPAGCILVVDEAQQFFRAATGSVPSYIAAMETIRHRGIRLIIITQHPMLIHANIRALIGRHEHLVRENGKQSAIVYRRNSVIDNVRSDSALNKEDYSSWAYPTDVFNAYKSAEVHTVKRVITSRAKRAIVLALIAVVMVGYVVHRIRSRIAADAEAAEQQKIAATTTQTGSRTADDFKPQTAEDYAQHFTPVIPSMPWSMPATMDREVIVQPKIFCMSSELFCNCLTEQGTRYLLPDAECRDIARHGPPYNPFEDQSTTWKGQPIEEPPNPQPQGAHQPVASGATSLPFGHMASYGDHGVAPKGTHSIGE